MVGTLALLFYLRFVKENEILFSCKYDILQNTNSG